MRTQNIQLKTPNSNHVEILTLHSVIHSLHSVFGFHHTRKQTDATDFSRRNKNAQKRASCMLNSQGRIIHEAGEAEASGPGPR